MTFRKQSVVALTAVALGSGQPAEAQLCGGAFDSALADLEGYFFDDEADYFRSALGVEQLEPGAPVAVVTEASLCRKVTREAERWLRGQPMKQQIDSYGWDFSIFRFGRYVTIYFVPRTATSADTFPPPPGQTVDPGPGILLLYEENGNDLTYVGHGLV